MFPITTINPETLAHLAFLVADENDYQLDVLQARQYHSGAQFVHLTARLREFLGGDSSDESRDADRLRLNIARIVVSAVVERLVVNNFDSDETGAAEEQPNALGQPTPAIVKPVADWAWKVWRANKMDAKQRRVHEATVRDSESFVIVDWDAQTMRPRFTPHLRYIDQSVGTGSNADVGEGCRAFYQNDDTDQALLYITKRWTEVTYTGDVRKERQRLTMYFPDKIVKYAGYPGAWEATKDPTDTTWPIPWVDKAGLPLGIPVAHFTSQGMEAREAWPAQNAINFLCALELTAADMTAFRILVALGWEPVDADGNDLPIKPGTWVGTTRKSTEADVRDIPPADIAPISNLIEGWVFRAAMATDTPVSRFITTKAVAAEGTQKQYDAPLVAKIENRQGELGNGWEACMNIARRLENTFGSGGLDEEVELYTGWKPAATRDEDAEIARAQKKQALGVPFVELMTELGYDMAKVTSWDEERKAEQEKEREALAKQGGGFATNGKAPFVR
jgi:hypothetical protein